MRIDILTLFPGMFGAVLGESMLKIAQKKKKLRIKVHDLRRWTTDRHKTADDRPYGGGSGMIIKIEPVYRALESLLGSKRMRGLMEKKTAGDRTEIILLTPRGRTLNQKMARKLSRLRRMVLIAGHYEGIDERARNLTTAEISVGDYVLTGGELPAMVLVDAVARLLPGVLGDSNSLRRESFDRNLLEYPQYTRPREFMGMRVPGVLLNGDHEAIKSWRDRESLKETRKSRGDLYRTGKK